MYLVVKSFSEAQKGIEGFYDGVINAVTDESTHISASMEENDAVSMTMFLSNKYYDAKLQLSGSLEEDGVLENVKCIVIQLDPSINNLDEVVTWNGDNNDVLSRIDVLKLIVMETLEEMTDSDRNRILDWCFQNEIELIELKRPNNISSDDEEFHDYGYERVCQALHSHTWDSSCITLKVRSKCQATDSDSDKENLLQNGAATVSNGHNEEKFYDEFLDRISHASDSDVDFESDPEDSDKDIDDKTEYQTLDVTHEIPMCSKPLSECGNEESAENFETLFNQLIDLRDKRSATSVDDEHRRQAAADIAMKFWQSIGGDDDDTDASHDDSGQKN